MRTKNAQPNYRMSVAIMIRSVTRIAMKWFDPHSSQIVQDLAQKDRDGCLTRETVTCITCANRSVNKNIEFITGPAGPCSGISMILGADGSQRKIA